MFDSSFRYGVSSFRHFVMSFGRFVTAFRRFGTPILLVDSLFSEVDSAKCQFDSSAGLVCRFIVLSFRHVVSSFRYVVSSRLHREVIIRVHYMKCLPDSMHLYMTRLFIIYSVLTENVENGFFEELPTAQHGIHVKSSE